MFIMCSVEETLREPFYLVEMASGVVNTLHPWSGNGVMQVSMHWRGGCCVGKGKGRLGWLVMDTSWSSLF